MQIFSLIKKDEINYDFYVKLHQVKWLWNEKKQFLSHNSSLKFLDERKK